MRFDGRRWRTGRRSARDELDETSLPRGALVVGGVSQFDGRSS